MKCTTKYCRKQAVKNRTLCASCIKNKYKEKHPIRYAFSVLKNNAKRRNIDFELTFEYFEQFCCKYDYLKGKGKKAESYSIDRIDNAKGYVEGNVQILTLSENSRKGIKILNAIYNPETKKIDAYVTSCNHLNNEIPNWDKILEDTLSEIDSAHNHSDSCNCDIPF